jgi:signal recognition particle subunit SRP54
MDKMEAVISSMTLKERRNPKILNYSRKQRISKGSGTTLQDINRLLKQYEQLKKAMKQFNKMGKKKFFGKMPFKM